MNVIYQNVYEKDLLDQHATRSPQAVGLYNIKKKVALKIDFKSWQFSIQQKGKLSTIISYIYEWQIHYLRFKFPKNFEKK